MKKVIYLFALMFAMVLISTNCEKDDDPIVTDGAITLDELQGIWISTQYDYDKTYYECSELSVSTNGDVLAGDLMLISLNIGSEWTLDSECTSLETYGNTVDYDRNAGKLVLKNGGIFVCKFDVESFDRANKILVLKLTDANMGGVYLPDNGVYTLQK